ncbi:MAG: ribosome silencing factor [Bacillota bacterium]|nr:ribosome silencing factor [Bacillota bacterium]
MTNSLDLVKDIVQIIDDKKAQEISVLDLDKVSLVADYFVICTGNSSTQTKAISDYILKELEQKPLRIEGYKGANWILLDFGSVVVHIFLEETREFYDLERLWGDARTVEKSTIGI